MNEPAILIDNVEFGFSGDGRKLLHGLSLRVKAGEFIAVLGPSGVGKSTMLNLIAGLLAPTKGRVEVFGTPVSGLNDSDATRFRRGRIGFVFQQFHLLPHLTVEENVALPLALQQHRWDPDLAREVLDRLGLGHRMRAYPRTLSGGEAQRTAIARALIHRPALVLADEPTGNLDPETANEVLDLFTSLVRERGTTTVLVTHSMLAAKRADRVFRLAA